MMGVSGAAAIERLVELGVDAIGANCGNNLADTEAALVEMRAADPDVLLISKANAGMPEWHGAELRYSGSPDVMAAHADRQRAAGVQIIGACCGSSPEHVAMMRRVLDGQVAVPDVEVHAAADRQGGRTRERRSRRTRAS
jgi:5-methyltetrahydrofolate--homocysteine methyltransferase